MTDLSYEKIKEKIENYYKNKINIEISITDQKEKKDILTNLVKSNIIDKDYGLFKMIELDDVIILEYEEIDLNKRKKTDNIIVINEQHGMFKIEHYEPVNNFYYKEDTISTYGLDKRLINRISVKDMSSLTEIKLLDKNLVTDEYYKKNYTFLKNEDEIISLKINNEMYLKGENSFENRFQATTNLISQVYNKVNDKLDIVLGIENVKEYHILRKKQGR